MEPLTLIVTAVVAGAALAAKDVANSAIRDAYDGLKTLIIRKYADRADVEEAITGVEAKPDSKGRQMILAEELKSAGADRDDNVIKGAKAVHKACKKAGPEAANYYNAVLKGSGSIAQHGSVAAGAGGIAIGGSVQGPVVKGSRNLVGDVHGDVDMSEGKRSQSGKYITNIDQGAGTVIGDESHVDQHFNDDD